MAKTKGKKNKPNKTRKLKPMVCNPNVEKGKKDMCLSDNIILNLKDAFNKKNSKNKISKSNPDKIRSSLKNKLDKCYSEDCWLDIIEDQNLRKKLKKQFFAPYQPKEWKKSKSTWLTNYDIRDVLKQYEQKYKNFKMIGPSPIDFDAKPYLEDTCVWEDLCTFSLANCIKQKKDKIGIIINLDKHDENGSHWVSLFLDLDEHILFYMDSAGNEIPNEIKALVDRIIDESKKLDMDTIVYHSNYPTVHQYGNNECGMYTLYFIISMLTNKKGNVNFKNMNDKLDYFKTKRISDTFIHNHRNKYFNS